MLAQFYAVFETRPVAVAGIRLLPFSLWQAFNLRSLRNPYVVGGPVTASDLVQAVMWCTVLYGRSEWWQRRAWAVRCMRAHLTARIGVSVGAWVRAHAELVTHINRFSFVPEHWEPVTPPADTGVRAPWEMHLARVLCKEYRFSLADAWNTPINQARAWADVVSETAGDKSLVSDDDAAMGEEAKWGVA